MLRFPYKLLALATVLLLFCTGCQIQMGFPGDLTDQSATAKVPKETDLATPSNPPAVSDDPMSEPTSQAPHTPVTPSISQSQTADAPVTDEPALPKKRVAFTFDDGPDTVRTYKFVDKLKEYGASATFFIVGNRVTQSGGAAIAYAYENGCEIGIHSYTHTTPLYYHVCTDAEYAQDMQQTADAINTYVAAPVTLMRPPGGNITAERVVACPYGVILWSVDSEDWRYKSRADEATIEVNVNTIVENVMKSIDDGDIVLMHEIYDNSYEAFCILIERLYQEGYEVVSVSKLLGDSLEPGQRYSQKK